jgi:hypothetical protein
MTSNRWQIPRQNVPTTDTYPERSSTSPSLSSRIHKTPASTCVSRQHQYLHRAVAAGRDGPNVIAEIFLKLPKIKAAHLDRLKENDFCPTLMAEVVRLSVSPPKYAI